jgi:hypothetical protein
MVEKTQAGAGGPPDPQTERRVKEFVKRFASDSEEEPEPESMAWKLDSDDDSWSRSSRKGRRSRKNYSRFLANRIRANEGELRDEREAQALAEGPDFS